MNIKRIIKSGESDTVEFKESTAEWRRIIETISAFSNTKGGLILIGIKDDGKVVGVNIGKSTVEDLTNKIINNTQPEVYPEIMVKECDNKRLILINVDKYPNDVVLAFNTPFKRVGRSTLKMNNDEYSNRILAIHRKELYFDGLICEGADIADIDMNKVKAFLYKAMEARKSNIKGLSVKSVLKRLRLIKDGEITNAYMLLFGKNPQDYFIQASIKCARYRGIQITSDMLDFKDIEADLFSQVNDAERFILNNISKRAWVEEGKLERQERWEYPIEAIREALVNAIVHRDYRARGKIQIRIYDDRIEFWNAGRLPEGWSIDTLKREHISEPFNPLIFRIFYLAGLVEEMGSGTNKIISLCKDYGLPEPEFGIVGNSIFIKIRKDIYTEDYLKGTGLNDRQIKAVMYVKEKGKITNKEYQKVCNISERTASRELDRLVKSNILKKIGVTGKGTYYILSSHKDAKDARK